MLGITPISSNPISDIGDGSAPPASSSVTVGSPITIPTNEDVIVIMQV